MAFKIRTETPKDYFAVENLTREAFWHADTPDRPELNAADMPNCDEHLLVHCMRQSPFFVKELAFVATRLTTSGEKIVGNIMYCESWLEKPTGEKTTVLTFGPLSVLPEYQRMGIGGALINHSFAKATKLGYPGIVIFGHPQYYPRFGFENAEKYNISTTEGENFDAFMALELTPGALKNSNARLLLPPVYNVDITRLQAFDIKFPKKLK